MWSFVADSPIDERNKTLCTDGGWLLYSYEMLVRPRINKISRGLIFLQQRL